MDRAEAVKMLETQLDVTSVNTPSCIELHEALNLAIKALQQTEIVRCKDCKWHEHGGLPCPLDAFESLDDDGYCSRGERSE